MTTTLDAVKTKKQEVDDRSAEAAAAAELVRVAREKGLSLTGPDGLLKLFTKNVLETALNEEMTEHLGHAKHRATPGREEGNIRNGTRPKTVLTDAVGQITIGSRPLISSGVHPFRRWVSTQCTSRSYLIRYG